MLRVGVEIRNTDGFREHVEHKKGPTSALWDTLQIQVNKGINIMERSMLRRYNYEKLFVYLSTDATQATRGKTNEKILRKLHIHEFIWKKNGRKSSLLIIFKCCGVLQGRSEERGETLIKL